MQNMILQPKGLNLFFLIDCSDETGRRIDEVIDAVKSVIPSLQEYNKRYSKMNMSVRVLRISSGASFTNPAAVHINNFRAGRLFPGGGFDFGKGLDIIYQQLQGMGKESVPPVMVLVSNGHPSDDYKAALAKLKTLPIYKATIRLAFALDDKADKKVLREFACTDTDVRDFKRFTDFPRLFEH